MLRPIMGKGWMCWSLCLAWSASPLLDAQILESAAVVDTGVQPTALELDPQGGHLYLTAFAADLLQRWETTPGCELRASSSFSTAKGPLSLALDTRGEQLLVAAFGSNRVQLYQTGAPQKPPALYEVGEGPTRVLVDPQGRWAAVLNFFDSSLSWISPLSPQPQGPPPALPVLPNPDRGALSPSATHLYVGSTSGPLIQIFQISSSSLPRQAGEWKLPEGSVQDLLFHPHLPLLYVAAGEANQIFLLRVAEDGSLKQAGQLPLQDYPAALSMDPEGRKLVVACRHSNDVYYFRIGPQGELQQRASFPTYEYPEDLVLSREGGCLYVLASAYGKLHALRLRDP